MKKPFMEMHSKPAPFAPSKGNEYEFTPIDPSKPVYYGFCASMKDAADHAEQAKVSMYRKIK